MLKDSEICIKLLNEGNYTCVIAKNGEIYKSECRGVKPLLDFLDSEKSFEGFSAADRVVGKAAAFIYLLMNVDNVYAHTISKPALSLLENGGVRVSYSELVDAIRNRTNTGFCPMEQAVIDITVPEEAIEAIKNKIIQLSSI